MRVRQPLAVSGFSFAGGLFLCCFLSPRQMWVLLLHTLLLAAAGGWLFWKKKGGFLLLAGLMSLAACIVSIFLQNQLAARWELAAGQDVVLSGRVGEGSASSGWVIQNARISLGGRTFTAGVLLTGDQDLLLYEGEQVEISAKAADRLPALPQLARGAELVLRADSATLAVTSPQPWWGKLREDVLQRLQRSLRRTMGRDAAGLMEAMLTGDSDAIPQRLYGSFQRAGAAHILCVSGLHLSLLCGMAASLLTPLAGRRRALVGGLLTMLLFVLLTGSGPSALRALLMASMAAAAELAFRDSTPVNALGGVVLLLTVINPRLVCRMGFLMSVLSVLAVTAAAPAFTDAAAQLFKLRERSQLRGLVSAAATAAAVPIVTLPVSVLFFGYTPLFAPVVNLLILPLMPVLLGCGLLAGLGFGPAGFVCEKLLLLVQTAVELGAKGPVLPLRTEALIPCAVCVGILLLIPIALKGKAASKIAACALSVVVTVWGAFFAAYSRGDSLSVSQYVASSGSSIVLQKGTDAVVIGCGGSAYEGRVLADELLAAGVTRISGVIIPADRLCYTGGAYSLLTILGAEKVVTPESSRMLQAFASAEVEEMLLLAPSRWLLFSEYECLLRTGGGQAVLLVGLTDGQLCLDYQKNPAPYESAYRLFCDLKAEEDKTPKSASLMALSLRAGPDLRWRPGQGDGKEQGYAFL